MEKKKVLITGYTSRMCNSPRVRGDYVTFSTMLPLILAEMGYDVDHRAVSVGENIEGKYYYAFGGIAPLTSISAAAVPQTHWVMQQMGNRYAVFFDDWATCVFGRIARRVLRDWAQFCFYKNWGYDISILESIGNHIKTMVTVVNKDFNPPILAPMFKWGDHQFLLRNNFNANLISIDPSAWMKFPNVKVPTPKNRAKQWVMAALSDHSLWVTRQKFSFPVKFVGNIRKNGGIFMTEDDTIQLMANSFGVLSVQYPSAGSGWWRSRYLNAAWAESPIYSGPRDSVYMGEAYRGYPQNFESEYLTPKYTERIKAQNEWLQQNIETKDEVIAKMEALLK